MSTEQKQVEIAAKMYRARDAVITLIGEDKFKEKVDQFRPIMQGMCEQKKCTEIEATIEILEALKGKERETMLAMAACTEIIEG